MRDRGGPVQACTGAVGLKKLQGVNYADNTFKGVLNHQVVFLCQAQGSTSSRIP